MTDTTLAFLTGSIVSLIWSYFPSVKEWYDAKSKDWKSIINIATLAAVALGVFGLSCAGVTGLVECSKDGLIVLGRSFALALMGNQATYGATRRLFRD